MIALTDRQKEVLRALTELTRANGYPPTVRELGESLGVTTPNGINGHLIRLRAKGIITWEPGKVRTLRIANKRGLRDNWTA